MGQFTKRPVTVEAVQFNKIGDHPAVEVGFGGGYCIEGRQGFVSVDAGDWIITEMNGAGFYPCKPDVFEVTYAPAQDSVSDKAEPASDLSFGAAIRALKRGDRVCRTGWNGRGMWLALTQGTPNLPAEKFWNPHNRAFAEQNGGAATVLPAITMKTATGEILIGWLASQTDMLAEDSMVLPADVA